MHKYLVSYPDTESASFSKDIALHAEFYPDRMARGNANVARGSANVARGNDDNDESTTWFPHQRLIARYISHLTLYDSLGVFHDVGTGKTGVAIAVMEGLRKTNNVRRVLFLANNETILANLQNELIRKSSSIRMAAARRYPSFRRDGTSGRQLTPREWKLVFSQEHITFDTYEQFAADMEKRRSAGTLTDKLLFEQ
ncbi:hypothetical protein EBU99_15060, partial [bacterium]|nr:hypothetical protein [bacterium]